MTEIKFDFKEIDEEGFETLEAVASASAFNQWMYQTIKPFCKGKILEIGSGIGNISDYFLRDGADIILSDIRQNYLEALEKRFGADKLANRLFLLDVLNNEQLGQIQTKHNGFDTIFALNVFEHIEDHKQALANCYNLLNPGGQLIILVPAHQWLYNRFDHELYHYRRYNKKTLSQIFIKNKVPVVKTFYFNSGGILGWYVSGKIMGNKTIPKGQMGFYNLLVPIFKFIDFITGRKLGLSVVAVGQKPK